MAQMKWWGWGDDDVVFTHEDKPEFGPFLEREIDVHVDAPSERPVAFAALDVPDPAVDAELAGALEATGSSTPAASACATSSAIATATWGASPTSSSGPGPRPRSRP